MNKLLWRFRFALAVRKIFSSPKGVFTGNHFRLGWKVSAKANKEMLKMNPRDAALEEVSRWYSNDI